jgi:predicted dehydrogenase
MSNMRKDRRQFIKALPATGLALAAFPAFASRPKQIEYAPARVPVSFAAPRIKFSVIGLNHGHIFSQTDNVIRGGGELVSFFAREDDLAVNFMKRYPSVKRVRDERQILEDTQIRLVVSASIPDERAALAVRAMQHGKDFMVDKPGVVSLQQLEQVRKVQRETGRIYSVLFGERLENGATVAAAEMIRSGAIGRVVQTLGLGPHRINIKTRPQWFFDNTRYGGIICDIGSHQCDQFLYLTGSTSAEVMFSQVGNINHPQYPGLQDFGDATLRGNGGTGYFRVDWFTPDGLKTWGDGRLTVLGTDGFIEIRKNIDITRSDQGNHLFITDHKGTRYMDCNNVPLPYGTQLVNDIVDRTETAMSQEHCFLAMELALRAQHNATRLVIE